MVAFCDADYANDIATRRSVTGAVVMFGNSPLYWQSTRQSIVTLSTAEAEYVSGCDLVKELIPLRSLMLEAKIIGPAPTKIFIDNQSTIKMAANLVSRQRTKHIDVRSRWLSEKVEAGLVETEFVDSEKNVADILTKPLSKVRFSLLRALLLNLALVSIAEGYTFAKVDPVYYKPSSVHYLTGTETHQVVVIVNNPCQAYFENLLVDSKLNQKLLDDCDRWFSRATRSKLKNCQMVANNTWWFSLSSLDKKTKRVPPLLMLLGAVMYASGTYVYIQGEQNEDNIKMMAQALNDEVNTTKRAVEALQQVKNSIGDLANGEILLERRIDYLNLTMQNVPKAIALISDASHYFDSLELQLSLIDYNLKDKRVSAELFKLIGTRLYPQQVDHWAIIQSCKWSFTGLLNVAMNIQLSVPTLDSSSEVLESVAFKFWNRSSNNELCRLKYTGPRFILANATTQCYMGVDNTWIEDNSLEGHPCEKTESQLTNLRKIFQSEVCVQEFKASVSDIQVKRLNGFFRIYCYGHEIVIKNLSYFCPEFVFELPQTEPFQLNGHVNFVSNKTKISVNPHELQLNREVARQLKLDHIKIEPFNLTLVDASVRLAGRLAAKLGANVTLVEQSLSNILPDFGIVNKLSEIFRYAEIFILVLLGILVIATLVVISPLFSLLRLVARSTRFLIISIYRKFKRNTDNELLRQVNRRDYIA